MLDDYARRGVLDLSVAAPDLGSTFLRDRFTDCLERVLCRFDRRCCELDCIELGRLECVEKIRYCERD